MVLDVVCRRIAVGAPPTEPTKYLGDPSAPSLFRTLPTLEIAKARNRTKRYQALARKRRERERRLAAERKRCHGEERLSYRALQRRRFCEWHQTDLNPRALPHVTLGFGAVAREILVKRSARPVYPQAPGSAARAGERRYSRDPRWHMTKKRPSSARLQPGEASHFIPARGTFLRE